MKAADKITVSVGYAYPSSSTANKANRGSEGTYYVSIIIDHLPKEKEIYLCYHETTESASEYAQRLELPYHKFSKHIKK